MWQPEKSSNHGPDYAGFMPLIIWWLSFSATFTWLLFEISS